MVIFARGGGVVETVVLGWGKWAGSTDWYKREEGLEGDEREDDGE